MKAEFPNTAPVDLTGLNGLYEFLLYYFFKNNKRHFE